MDEELELLKKEIELFLETISLYKGDRIISFDKSVEDHNKKWIKEKMMQIKSGNVDEKLLDKAIDELYPYY